MSLSTGNVLDYATRTKTIPDSLLEQVSSVVGDVIGACSRLMSPEGKQSFNECLKIVIQGFGEEGKGLSSVKMWICAFMSARKFAPVYTPHSPTHCRLRRGVPAHSFATPIHTPFPPRTLTLSHPCQDIAELHPTTQPPGIPEEHKKKEETSRSTTSLGKTPHTDFSQSQQPAYH
ncbi:hypothetical protein ACROYT_G014132 [Oculina patagonica]